MHPQLAKAIERDCLGAADQEQGKLPRGFLYCLYCKPMTYKNVIWFNGHLVGLSCGLCETCNSVYVVRSNSTMEYRPAGEHSRWKCQQPIKGFDDDLYDHVKLVKSCA